MTKDTILRVRVRSYELALVNRARNITGEPTVSGFVHRAILEAARTALVAGEQEVDADDRANCI